MTNLLLIATSADGDLDTIAAQYRAEGYTVKRGTAPSGAPALYRVELLVCMLCEAGTLDANDQCTECGAQAVA